jgi:hypothetical protein
MEPPVVLAAALAALTLGWGPALLRGANAISSRLGAGWTLALPGDVALDAGSWRTIALLLLPALGWISWRIYRWSEALVWKAARAQGFSSPI